jgi:hypothetical protein
MLGAQPKGRAADDVPTSLEISSGGPESTPEQLRASLPSLSNPGVRSELARQFGLRELAGKPLYLKTEGSRGSGEVSAARVDLASDFDHMVTGDATSIAGRQRNSSVAVNPVDQNIVVVVAENTSSITGNSTDCSVYLSFDGGISYSYDHDEALGAPPISCGSPKAVFSPDGQYLYIAYLQVSAGGTNLMMHRYPGFNPTAPSFTLTVLGPGLDSPSLGVHAWDSGGGADKVYLAFTQFAAPACSIKLLSLGSYGTSISAFPTLATSPLCTGSTPGTPASLSERLLQGPTVAGGPGTQVLACWYDAGVDGNSTPVQIAPPVPPTPVAPLNKFNIACRSSNDRGVTFAGDPNPPEAVTPADNTRWIYAAKNVVAELPYWLGPKGLYFSISAGSYPSLAIDHLGAAHIAFSYNPAATNRFTAESANVAYVKSVNSIPTTLVPTIYSKWSLKTTLAGGSGAQLFPTVAAQHVHESGKPYIYVGWLDTIASVPLGAANANIIYDVRYRVSKTGGPTFGTPIVSSDHASTSDYVSVGNYLGSTAGPGIFHFSWTDNRFSFSIYSPKEHIFTDRN